jgi:hypothetical protein
MLLIRKAQQDALGDSSTRRFEDALCEHVARAYPSEYAELGEDGTRAFVSHNRQRAMRYGIDTLGGIVTFIELLLTFGEEFELSPDGVQAALLLQDASLPGQVKIAYLAECLTSRTGGRKIIST